ncbi:MAG: hypothetical protein KatS3mg061_2753 [Dehalococcoidia bacterium]|nr:MAG: hypothetical protein KatS3mg061_2753 [Dehalococcoidia bacterium]
MTLTPARAPIASADLAATRLRREVINERVAKLLPLEQARALNALPIERTGAEVTLAVARPLDATTIRRLERQFGARVRQVRALLNEVRAAIAAVWGEAVPPPPEVLLGQWLRLLGYLSDEELAVALIRHREQGIPLGRALLAIGTVTEEQLLAALALRLGLPTVSLQRYPVAPGVNALLERAFAMEHRVLPFSGDGTVLLVAIAEDTRREALEQLAYQTGYTVRPVLCPVGQLEAAIAQAFARDTTRPEVLSLPLVFLQQGLVRASDIDLAFEVSERNGEELVDVLIRQMRLDEARLRAAQAAQYGLGLVTSPPFLKAEYAQLLPRPLAERHRAIVIGVSETSIELAVASPLDRALEEWLAYVSLKTVNTVLADPALIERLQRQLYYGRSTPVRVEIEPLAQLLLRDGLLTHQQLDEVLALQEARGLPFPRALVASGILTEDDLAAVQSLWLGLPRVQLDHFRFDFSLLERVGPTPLLDHRVAPLTQLDGTVVVAMADPLDASGLEVVEQATGLRALPVVAAQPEIIAAIERTFVIQQMPDVARLSLLGTTLVSKYVLTSVQWREAEQKMNAGTPLDLAILSSTDRNPEELARDLAEVFGLPSVDLEPRQTSERIIDALGIETTRLRWIDPVDAVVARRMPLETARALAALPIAVEGDQFVVAIADPADTALQERVASVLGTDRIRWVVASRRAIELAIDRTIGRKNLGTYLLEAGLITQTELARALDYQQRTGTRLGQALITLGILRPDQLTEFLAMQHGLIAVDLTTMPPPPQIVRLLPEELERRHGLVPIAVQNGIITIAMVDPLDEAAVEEVRRITGRQVERVLTTEGEITAILQDVYRAEYLRQSAMDLVIRSPEDSAIRILSRGQKLFLLAFVVVSVVLLFLVPIPYLIVLNGLATLFYVAFSTYRFYLIFKALGYSLEVPVTPEEVAALDERELPVYTILIPLYREAAVAPRLVAAIDRLDYPKAKLDVKLLIEEDDTETLEGLLAANLPAHFKILIVPHGLPKGKPKACNYGLIQAQGEYVVIYDAEDIPDPDQLKKVILVFKKSDPKLACVQCKLNYYNRRQNLLTKWFTTEYSMWFDLFLPGLDASNAPIPLGGTSNHFRTQQLKAIGAWDPWNVTEDADIGIRLYKQGLTTAIVDSTTYEEANSELWNWIRQRSRWVKGYIQTWLVHMRNPFRLMRELGPMAFLSFNFVVGGTFFAFLMNPVYWLLTMLWFLTRAGFIEQIFPGIIFYLGAFALYIGNFAFAYISVAGCVRRKYYDMVKYAVISPLYWALMSIGAWKGFLQLFYKPFYWEKTVHGLYAGPVDTRPGGRVLG